MTNPEQILKNLEGSAITLDSNIAYHGSALKVEFTAVRGKMFNYYKWYGHWLECSKEEAIQTLQDY